MNKNRRPQASKALRVRADVEHVQNLRRGNATQPIPSGKTYKREKAGARNRDW